MCVPVGNFRGWNAVFLWIFEVYYAMLSLASYHRSFHPISVPITSYHQSEKTNCEYVSMRSQR